MQDFPSGAKEQYSLGKLVTAPLPCVAMRERANITEACNRLYLAAAWIKQQDDRHCLISTND